MSIIGEKLTLKYAPKSLDDVIIPERIRTMLESGATNHMLLYGTPGTGKTSTAIAYCEHYGYEYLYIDASTDTSVNVIREQILNFASSMSLIGGTGALKIVILDEIDGVSDQFTKALKGTIEKVEKNCRFIATTNHINKVADTVLSRFKQYSYDFTEEEATEMLKKYILRINDIAKEEGLKFDKDAIVEFVRRSFPDMRSMLNSLQAYRDEGITHITLEHVRKFHGIYKDVYELLVGKPDTINNYKYLVSEYSNKVDDILATMGTDFIDYIQMEKPELMTKVPQIIVEVAKYQAQRIRVIDPVVSMLACAFTIQKIVNQ